MPLDSLEWLTVDRDTPKLGDNGPPRFPPQPPRGPPGPRRNPKKSKTPEDDILPFASIGIGYGVATGLAFFAFNTRAIGLILGMHAVTFAVTHGLLDDKWADSGRAGKLLGSFGAKNWGHFSPLKKAFIASGLALTISSATDYLASNYLSDGTRKTISVSQVLQKAYYDVGCSISASAPDSYFKANNCLNRPKPRSELHL